MNGSKRNKRAIIGGLALTAVCFVCACSNSGQNQTTHIPTAEPTATSMGSVNYFV